MALVVWKRERKGRDAKLKSRVLAGVGVGTVRGHRSPVTDAGVSLFGRSVVQHISAHAIFIIEKLYLNPAEARDSLYVNIDHKEASNRFIIVSQLAFRVNDGGRKRCRLSVARPYLKEKSSAALPRLISNSEWFSERC